VLGVSDGSDSIERAYLREEGDGVLCSFMWSGGPVEEGAISVPTGSWDRAVILSYERGSTAAGETARGGSSIWLSMQVRFAWSAIGSRNPGRNGPVESRSRICGVEIASLTGYTLSP
jgi:hypothetical protein